MPGTKQLTRDSRMAAFQNGDRSSNARRSRSLKVKRAQSYEVNSSGDSTRSLLSPLYHSSFEDDDDEKLDFSRAKSAFMENVGTGDRPKSTDRCFQNGDSSSSARRSHSLKVKRAQSYEVSSSGDSTRSLLSPLYHSSFEDDDDDEKLDFSRAKSAFMENVGTGDRPKSTDRCFQNGDSSSSARRSHSLKVKRAQSYEVSSSGDSTRSLLSPLYHSSFEDDDDDDEKLDFSRAKSAFMENVGTGDRPKSTDRCYIYKELFIQELKPLNL